MRIAIPERNDISVLWIQILGAAVVAGLVAAVADLDSRMFVDMAAGDEMAAVATMAVATKEYV
jgi:hypothetical protein